MGECSFGTGPINVQATTINYLGKVERMSGTEQPPLKDYNEDRIYQPYNPYTLDLVPTLRHKSVKKSRNNAPEGITYKSNQQAIRNYKNSNPSPPLDLQGFLGINENTSKKEISINNMIKVAQGKKNAERYMKMYCDDIEALLNEIDTFITTNGYEEFLIATTESFDKRDEVASMKLIYKNTQLPNLLKFFNEREEKLKIFGDRITLRKDIYVSGYACEEKINKLYQKIGRYKSTLGSVELLNEDIDIIIKRGICFDKNQFDNLIKANIINPSEWSPYIYIRQEHQMYGGQKTMILVYIHSTEPTYNYNGDVLPKFDNSYAEIKNSKGNTVKYVKKTGGGKSKKRSNSKRSKTHKKRRS